MKIQGKYLLIPLLLLCTLPALSALLCFAAVPASAATLVVAESGGDYRNIQEAIDNASPGDTIEVKPGTYPDTVTVYYPLTLAGSPESEGNGEDSRSEEGSRTGDEGVIEKECIIGEKGTPIALYVSSGDVVLRDLSFRGNFSGVFLNSSDGSLIEGCNFKDSETALRILDSSECIVQDCEFLAGHTGIELENSNSTVVRESRLSAPAAGIVAKASRNVLITGNRLENCELGIAATGLQNSRIEENNLSSLMAGIVFIASENCEVENNPTEGVTQYLQFFTSQACRVETETLIGGPGPDPYYFAADIFSETLYSCGEYSVTGHDYALLYHPYAAPESSGYRQFGEACNISFINVSENAAGFAVLTAEISDSELEGYDPETFGFYSVDEKPTLISLIDTENGTIYAEAVVKGPGAGHYALMARESSSQWIILLALLIGIVLVGAFAISRKKKE